MSQGKKSEQDAYFQQRRLALHREACERQESFYLDPETGLSVTTEYEHLTRGKCCRSGCRHCPYGFRKVNASEQS